MGTWVDAGIGAIVGLTLMGPAGAFFGLIGGWFMGHMATEDPAWQTYFWGILIAIVAIALAAIVWKIL